MSVVTITDRARAVLAISDELAMLDARIADERACHDLVLAEEAARHARTIDILRTQQIALEQAIFRLGAN